MILKSFAAHHETRSRPLAVLVFTTGTLFAGATIAQTGGAAGAVTPTDQAKYALEEIVVTARKKTETLQDVAASISAYTGDTLANLNITQAAELAEVTPGVTIEPPAVGNATSAKVTIRGQVQSDNLITLDPSVGWYLDEIYLARAYATNLSLFDVQRVEVLKGPQGTLYGRNTTGGAVKIVTAKADPSGEVSGFITGNIGNFDSRTIGGAVNLPLVSQKFAVRLTAQADERDGYAHVDLINPATFAPEGRRAVGDKDSDLVRVNATWLPTENLSIWAGYEHGKTELTYLHYNLVGDSLFGGRSSDDFYRAQLNTIPRSTANADTFNLTGEYRFTANVATKLVLGYRDVESTFDSDVDGTAVPIAGFAEPLKQQAHQFSAEWQLSAPLFNDKVDLITGLYYFSEKGSDESNSLGDLSGFLISRIYGLADKNESQSVFLHTTTHLTDRVDFNAGLRYTKDTKALYKENELFAPDGTFLLCSNSDPAVDPATCSTSREDSFKFPSWNVGFDWHVSPDLMLYVKGASASRSGGQNVRGLDAASSQPFDRETATDIEIGIKSEFWNRRARLNASYYHTFYEDIQQSNLVQTPRGLATFVVNAGKADIDGIEAELTLVVTDEFSLTTTAGYLDWKFDDYGPVLNSAPKYEFSAAAHYEHPVSFGAFKADLNYAWRDKYFPATNRDTLAAFKEATVDSLGLLNGRVTFDVSAWDLSVSLWGKNLTDEEYSNVGIVIFAPPMLTINNATIGEPRD